MRREIAVFINMAAAERAGQAAVQETGLLYDLRRKHKRGAMLGVTVWLRHASASKADAIPLME